MIHQDSNFKSTWSHGALASDWGNLCSHLMILSDFVVINVTITGGIYNANGEMKHDDMPQFAGVSICAKYDWLTFNQVMLCIEYHPHCVWVTNVNNLLPQKPRPGTNIHTW